MRFFKGLYKEYGQIINNFLERTTYNKEKIQVFLSAFIHAIPVFIISYFMNSQNIENLINQIPQEFEKFITINKNQKIIIERNFKYSIQFENLIKTYLTGLILEVKSFLSKIDIPLTDIQRLRKEVFNNLEVESNRIDKEIGDINVLENLQQDYKVYAELIGKKF